MTLFSSKQINEGRGIALLEVKDDILQEDVATERYKIYKKVLYEPKIDIYTLQCLMVPLRVIWRHLGTKQTIISLENSAIIHK